MWSVSERLTGIGFTSCPALKSAHLIKHFSKTAAWAFVLAESTYSLFPQRTPHDQRLCVLLIQRIPITKYSYSYHEMPNGCLNTRATAQVPKRCIVAI